MKKLFTLIYPVLCINILSWGQTLLISPTGDGGFENGITLAANNWTAVTNQYSNIDTWAVGSVPAVSAGTYCGYVTSNGGTSWTYSESGYPGSPSIIHLYHNVTFPAGESTGVISFKWKAQGEGTGTDNSDNMKVFFTPSSLTPQGSSPISSVYQVGANSYNQNASSWNIVNNITVTGIPGSTYKIIFSWYSNATNIVNPPAALDEISLISYIPTAANAAPVNFTTSAVTGSSMTIEWTDNSTNETGFRVYRSSDNVNFQQVGPDIISGNTNGTGTIYTQVQSGLLPGETYYYRIAAFFGLESPFLTGSQATPVSNLFGIKTIGGGGTPDYPTVQAAIADLNLQGIGSGGVSFKIAAGHTETFTSPTAGYITTVSSSASKPLVFEKNGSGANPVITAGTGNGTSDAIMLLAGSDYVTFDGINFTEAPANLNSTTQMEWGLAMLKNNSIGVDGSQHNIIKNCSITLNRNNPGCTGIFSENASISDPSFQLNVTSPEGTNSFNKIYGNIIHAYTGISLGGYGDATVTLYDQDNHIGVDGANQITNVAGTISTNPGYGIQARYQNNLKVANNAITSSMGGNATGVYGISLSSGKNASYDIYGNTISIQFSGPGSATFYGINADMSSLGTDNTVNVHNNTVTGCNFPTITNGTLRYINLNNPGVTSSVYGNVISNNSFGDATLPSTCNVYYLTVTKGSSINGVSHIYNNTVTGNQRKTASYGSSISIFVWGAGSGTALNMYGNVVTDNIVRATGNTIVFNCSQTGGSISVHDNYASGISEANGTTYGISCSVSSPGISAEIYGNTIQNIEGNGTSSKVQGIYHSISGSGSHSYIYNNRISDLRATAATGTSGDYLVGINIQNASNLSVDNNSVYLNGSSTAANFSSTAFYSQPSSSGTLLVRNNIFVNTSTPSGTGVTASIRFTNTTWNNFYSQLSNNNNLFAGTPGTYNVLFFDGTSKDQILNSYQTRMYPRETQAVSEMPPFVSISSGSTDLHLQPSVATQCESGGRIIEEPDTLFSDCDHQPRFPYSGYPNGVTPPVAPDMGADEFGGIPNDLTGPVIAYIPLAPTDLAGDRTLIAMISDVNGVPVSGPGLPMLYWKINSGTYSGVQGIYIDGNRYAFSFGAGAVSGDVVSYYVVAQDMITTPNVTASPFPGTSGYSTNPPTSGTIPSNPSTYSIVSSFTGTFHVGTGKDYSTLTQAALAINTHVLTGPVTLILDDATYPLETYPISFTANAGSNQDNILTIKPNSGVSTVLGSNASTTGIIDFDGIDYVMLDGSNNGTGSRNLTLINSKSGTSGTYAIGLRSGSGNVDPATNITIKNCIIQSVRVDASSSNTSAIRFLTPSSGYENIVIDNNAINSGYYGIQLYGTNGIGISRNVQVINNTIGSEIPSEAITRCGIDIQYADNTLIRNNEIMGASDGSTTKPQSGIQINTGATNTKVRKNSIHSFSHPADDGGGCYGIYYLSDASTVTEISDNLIFDLENGGSNPVINNNNTYGIYFLYGGNVKLIHNSVNLFGPYLSSSKNASSACLGFMNTASGGNFEVRNNIFRNGMTTNGGGPTTGRAYGVMFYNDISMFSALNNNDYWINGTDGFIAQQYAGTSSPAANFQDLSSWQSFTGEDGNSLNVDPEFTSDNDLIPTTTLMDNAGYYYISLPTDFDGASRSNPPDIGAYEFSTDQIVLTIAADNISGNSANLHGEVNASGYIVNTFFDYGLTTEYGNTVSSVPSQLTGNSFTGIHASISELAINTLYHFRARGLTTTGVTVYGEDMTFSTLTSSIKTVNLSSLFLEGLFEGAGTMRKAQDESGDHFPGTTADHITVELHDATSYSTLVFSSVNIALDINGTASFQVPGTHSGSYYLTIKHRNSIETVSALPVSFSGSIISYAFDSASKAFGNNLFQQGSYYCIYGGDENQDGLVDSSDMIDVDNDAAAFANGYLSTDVNGDGLLDSSDMILIDNNTSGFISVIKP